LDRRAGASVNVTVPVPVHKAVNTVSAGHMPRWTGIVVGLALLVAVSLTSLLFGARPISVRTALGALFSPDMQWIDHIVIRDYRLPRTLLGLLCGAAFGVSGALIQAATRNPLADPGILGVNAGAAFFVTLSVGLLGFHSIDAYLWF
ncbi:hypothetical protein BW45_24605, partial [Agrobacterium tumefaciens]